MHFEARRPALFAGERDRPMCIGCTRREPVLSRFLADVEKNAGRENGAATRRRDGSEGDEREGRRSPEKGTQIRAGLAE
jgi:hypothetical protein